MFLELSWEGIFRVSQKDESIVRRVESDHIQRQGSLK